MTDRLRRVDCLLAAGIARADDEQKTAGCRQRVQGAACRRSDGVWQGV